MQLFDSHAHLDDEKFDEDREQVIDIIKSSNTANFISAGYSIDGSIKALELAHKYPFIFATCGISPNDIPQSEEMLLKDIEKLIEIIEKELKNDIENNKLVAIGEIGLDYYWEKNQDMRDLQKKAFVKQIEIANKYNLPIVIHVRDAIIDVLDILKHNDVKMKGVFHCCPQNRELIKEALKLGFYISFARSSYF